MSNEHFPYDRTLRELLQSIPKRFTEIITGKRVTKVLDPTFPSVKERRADFLGVIEGEELIHIEVQAQNDPTLPERMIEILLLTKRVYGRVPLQMVLWVGEGKSPFGEVYEVGGITYRVRVVDIKEIDCKDLLESDDPNDNLLAVLCRRGEGFWERLSERVRGMSPRERENFIGKMMYLVKLRRDVYEEYEALRKEVSEMPIVIELEKDPAYLKGIEEGFEKGIEKGIKQGIKKGIKQGIKKGIEQGIIFEAQESVIENLEERFGMVSEEMREKIREIKDIDKLKRLRRIALRVNSVEEFEREL